MRSRKPLQTVSQMREDQLCNSLPADCGHLYATADRKVLPVLPDPHLNVFLRSLTWGRLIAVSSMIGSC